MVDEIVKLNEMNKIDNIEKSIADFGEYKKSLEDLQTIAYNNQDLNALYDQVENGAEWPRTTMTYQEYIDRSTKDLSDGKIDLSDPKNLEKINQCMEIKINELRKENQIPIVQYNPKIAEISQKYSAYMYSNKYYEHIDKQKNGPMERFEKTMPEVMAVGECIMKGKKTINEVFQAWIDSQLHKEIILKAKYVEMGVGFYKSYRTLDLIKK